jgi:hypothetical protein
VRLPAREVAQAGEFGVVDLGADGLAALAVVSTVSWSLRSSAEQDALVATFGRWLHAVSDPVHILVRAIPLDLSGHIAAIEDDAAHLTQLGHRALADAATDHADYLHWVGQEHQLLRRQILLSFREPNPPTPAGSDAAQARRDRAALNRLARRLGDAITLLAPAGLTVTPLCAEQAATVLHSACHPHLTTPAPNSPDTGAAPTAHPRARGDQGWYPLLAERGQQ